MNTKPVSISRPEFLEKTQKPTGLDRLARRLVRGRLAAIESGTVTLVEGDDSETFGNEVASFPLAVVIKVRSPAFYSDIAFGGSVGSGESYIHGTWECDDLESLVRILLRNREVLDDRGVGFEWPWPAGLVVHRCPRASRGYPCSSGARA